MPALRKLIRRLGDEIFKARTNTTLGRVGKGGQKVGGGLAIRTVEAHVEEVLLRAAGVSKVDLAALVQHDGLVEDVVDGLAGLVDGDDGSGSRVLRRQAERLYEFQGRSAVETTGAVVPALQRAASEGGLRNADALALAARNTADVLVADLGVDGVRQRQHCHDGIAHVHGILVPADAGEAVRGGTGARGEVEGVAGGHLGEVSFRLCLVDDFTAEVLVHLVPGDSLVLDVVALVEVKAVCFASQSLEEGRAATAKSRFSTELIEQSKQASKQASMILELTCQAVPGRSTSPRS